MTGPEQAPPPSVSTAPAEGASPGTSSPRAPLGRRRLPAHLGPARTSTVLLAVAFLAVGVLYLFVKPPETRTAAVVPDPVTTTSRSVAPTTPAPAATTPPEPAPPPEETAAPTPTSETAPTSEAPEATVEPTEVPTSPGGTTTAPEPQTGEPLPTTAAPSS